MRLIQLTRRPPAWLRIAVAGLVMAFVLSSIAHITHRHDSLPDTSAHVVACGYCLSFGSLADASVHHTPVLARVAGDEIVIACLPLLRSYQSPCAAQPRAPPLS